MAPTIIGQTIPDSVPTPLEMPIKILAYLGAMSKWFTLNPEIHTETMTQDGIILKKQYLVQSIRTHLPKRYWAHTMCFS